MAAQELPNLLVWVRFLGILLASNWRAMKVVLGFHYRGDKYREPIFKQIRPVLEGYDLWDDIIECDSGHIPYNRSASRNLVVKQAIDRSADVVVVCDADSLPEREPLEKSIYAATTADGIFTPFDRVHQLSASFVRNLPHNILRMRPFNTYGPSFGGCYVTTPDNWIRAGGMDERICGWGYEDQIFLVAAKTFLSGHQLHPGNLLTFEHPRQHEINFRRANSELRDLYNENCGNKEKIRELQAGSNDWRVKSA